ncbi:LPXTG cell wall anchor domain-containing protein [Limosilactobacillus mucosae]|uniref:LPXTG cell wall anchor domain-containing protein n=1 Tax=Limosilactobacillus mucosae TaxID=97478 RepID=UPI0022E2D29E|nr:LPXTG cell wall anchor domain-containing protein [Limosilactobacillus mucosae]
MVSNFASCFQDKQTALDDAIKHGQDVLNDPNADQKTVDETVAELEQAIGAIEAEFNNGENAKNVNSQGRAKGVNGSNHSVAITNSKQNNKSTLETLPQTGNQQNSWTVFAGLIAAVMSSLMMLLGIKKGNDDKEKN